MYVTALTKDSLAFIIFSMAIMMHPIVSIPVSFSLKCVRFLTMSFYFSVITFAQFYLTYTWEELRSNEITFSNNTGKTLTLNNAFGKRYNQCECDGTDSKCLVDISDRKTNIIGYTNYVTSSETVPYFMIGFAIVQIIALVCIELYRNEAVPMIQYMLGPKDWLISSANSERKSIFGSIMECFNGIATFSRRFHNVGNAMYVGNEYRPRKVPHSQHSIPLQVINVEKNVSSQTNVASPDQSSSENINMSSSKIETHLQDSTVEQNHNSSARTPSPTIKDEANDDSIPPIPFIDAEENVSSITDGASALQSSSENVNISSSMVEVPLQDSTEEHNLNSSARTQLPTIKDEVNDDSIPPIPSVNNQRPTIFDPIIDCFEGISTFSRRFHNAGNALYVGSESHPRQSSLPQCNKQNNAKPKKSKLILCYIVSLIYSVALFSIPHIAGIFEVSLVWQDQTCNDGYYNLNWNNSDIKVLKCEGKTSNNLTVKSCLICSNPLDFFLLSKKLQV